MKTFSFSTNWARRTAAIFLLTAAAAICPAHAATYTWNGATPPTIAAGGTHIVNLSGTPSGGLLVPAFTTVTIQNATAGAMLNNGDRILGVGLENGAKVIWTAKVTSTTQYQATVDIRGSSETSGTIAEIAAGAEIRNTGNGIALSSWAKENTINGATVSSNTQMAIGVVDKLTISGESLISSATTTNGTTIRNTDGGTLEILGGTIENRSTGNAIVNDHTNSKTIVRGGTIRANSGMAIRKGSGLVEILGGTITSVNTASDQGTIANTSTNGQLIVSGGAVRNTSSGNAIHNAGTLIINGGEVINTSTGNAIRNTGAGANASISHGFVFANKTNPIDNTGGATLHPRVYAVVVGWDRATWNGSWNKAAYGAFSTTHLTRYHEENPAPGSVAWDEQGGVGGIRYANGINTGFFPISEVSVRITDWTTSTPPDISAWTNTTSQNFGAVRISGSPSGTLNVPAGATIKIVNATAGATFDNFTRTMALNIGANAKVIWEANVSNGTRLLEVQGAGQLDFESGTEITSRAASHSVIHNDGTTKIVVKQGASITSTGNHTTTMRNAGLGTIEIAGGTIRNTNELENSSTPRAIENLGGGSVNITGGIVSTLRGNAVNNAAAGTITISGGTISATASAAVFNASTGTITISGAQTQITSQSISIAIGTLHNNAGGKIEILGGKVSNMTNDAGARAVYNNGAAGSIIVKGGLVEATTGRAIHNAAAGTITISGGTVSATTGTAIYNLVGGTISVSGGTVSATTGTAVRIQAGTGSITMTGGTITSQADASNATIWLQASGSTLNLNAGAVTNTAQGAANNRIIRANNSGAVVNLPAPVVGTVSNASVVRTFNNNSATLGAALSSPVAGASFSYVWQRGAANVGTSQTLSVRNVADNGTYTMTAHTNFAGFRSAQSASRNFSVNISALAVSVIPTAGQFKVFGDNDPVFAYTTSPSKPDGWSTQSVVLGREGDENVGNHRINSIKTNDAGTNYNVSLSNTNTTFEIRRATIGNVIPVSVAVRYNETNEQVLNLAQTLSHYNNPAQTLTFAPASATGANPNIIDVVSIPANGSGINFRIASLTQANSGQTATIPVKVSGFRNYNDIDLEIRVEITDKTVTQLSVTPPATRQYGEPFVAPSASADAGDVGTFVFLYSGTLRNGDTYPESQTPPTLPGNYQVKAELVSDSHIGSSSPQSFQIQKRLPHWTTKGTVASREYNATTSANVLTYPTLGNIVQGDVVSRHIDANAVSFVSANVGENIALQVLANWGIIGGTDVWKYEIDFVAPPEFIPANITPKTLTIAGLSAQNRVYNGSDVVNLSGGELVGVFDGDLTWVPSFPTFGIMANANAGTGKQVSIPDRIDDDGDVIGPGIELLDNEAGNYVLQQPSVSVDIERAGLTVSGVSAADKIYDGTASATVSGTAALSGVIGADAVSVVSGTAAFADANVGANKAVTFSGFSLSGAAAGNYTLSAQPASVTANITHAPLTITAADKSIYIGEDEPTYTFTANFVAGETAAALSTQPSFSLSPVFDNTQAGEFTITPSGAAAANYNITYASGKLTVSEATSISRPVQEKGYALFKESIVSEKMEILPEFAVTEVIIYDALGNVVHNSAFRIDGLTPSPLRVATSFPNSAFVWDLRNSAGRFVANGTYLVIVEAIGKDGKKVRYSGKVGVKR